VIGGGGGELLDEGAGDGIEEDACAFAAGDFPDAGDEIFLRGGDDVVGARLVELFAFLRGAGGGNRSGPCRFCRD
jgi:hypothetical protein